MRELLAHVRADGAVQSLWEHLKQTSELCSRFAERFGAGELGVLLGWLHDAGKARPGFQEYIRGGGHRGPESWHAMVGAWEAMAGGRSTEPLFPAIWGHHGGLPAVYEIGADASRRNEAKAAHAEAVANGWLLPAAVSLNPPLPAWLVGLSTPVSLHTKEVFVRMLFSCLVDADFLDTEAFMSPEKADMRGGSASVAELRGVLDAHMNALTGSARDTRINRLRAKVLSDCRAAAGCEQGVFSLAVPTGGGKTLSAMTFALGHAATHGLDRIIVAIPFTSIIEQNAKVYRDIFGAENVVEHHCSLDPDQDSGANRLACENWDAPIIVTTNVQLLESLFANRTAACRKLHNICRSVVIFDEAQTLPPGLLAPTISMLRELVDHYGVSVVLSTATQPALLKRQVNGRLRQPGFDSITPIIADDRALFERMRRVIVDWPEDYNSSTSWDQLVTDISEYPRVLAIVNRRADARHLAESLPEGTFHLSALMTPEHRSRVLTEIRGRLRDESAVCRVVSTSLIEAGVDVDFPVVYRERAPMDSIAQAAGRCNREGKREAGRVVVFVSPSAPLPGVHGKGVDATSILLQAGRRDLCDPSVYQEYFRRLYDAGDKDLRSIQPLRQKLNYPEVSKRYQLIEDGWSQPVIVSTDDRSRQAVEAIFENGPSRDLLRLLQQYSVSVQKGVVTGWRAGGVAMPLFPDSAPDQGPAVLAQPFVDSLYNSRFGLHCGEPKNLQANQIIV